MYRTHLHGTEDKIQIKAVWEGKSLLFQSQLPAFSLDFNLFLENIFTQQLEKVT